MSEISSGLVAFCYMSDQYEVALFSEPPTDPLYDDMFPVVRLSDAEAIIEKLSSKDRYGVCDECGTPYSFDPTDGGTICVKCQKDKIAQKDAEILEQCRINGMGAERESALLGKVAQQSAALKLARQVLMSVKETSSSTRLRRIVNEPLAAIHEVLKG